MHLKQAIDLKAQHRTDLASASFEDKIEALIRMQAMAQEMARAVGRPFEGVVWKKIPQPTDAGPKPLVRPAV